MYLLKGDFHKAILPLKRALELSRDLKERGVQAWSLRLLQALALAEELGMRPLQAHCHLGLGMLSREIGRPERARAELSTAMELYRAMGMTFWLCPVETALAQMEGR